MVDGNLTIQAQITLEDPDTSFVAFIVKDNISVSSSLGIPYAAVPAIPAAVVEGMYIAGGTLYTGRSTIASKERFVGKGMFAAKNILLQRTLGADNSAAGADLFIYNPAFLVTMPDILKDLSYTWQEVAP